MLKPPPPAAEPLRFVDLGAQYRRLKPAIDAAIAEVLEDGRFIGGPPVAALEAALGRHAGGVHTVACASGTDALLIALMAEDIGPGDAVFVPSFTFTATAEAVALLGAAPVFVDVAEESYLIDPADLEQRIARVEAEGSLRPRVVVAVDLFGQPADYATLAPLAAERGMLLISDAAQSFGAASGEEPAGGLAPVSTTSFYPAKPLGCYGDGGALFTRDEARADAYRSIREHGKGGERYDIRRIGLNSRLDSIQAAILLAKLPAFDAETAARERIAARYDAMLAGVCGLPGRLPGRRSVWAQYTIRVPRRDAVREALTARGIPTAVHYPLPMHLQPAYRHFGEGPGSLPVSERLAECVLCLPIHADLADETVAWIAEAVLEACAA